MSKEAVAEVAEPSDKSLYFKKDTYIPGKSAAGNKTFNNGDDIALALGGLDVDALEKVAVKLTGRDDLEGKYAHLNTGMQSMNYRNVIRAYLVKNPDDMKKFIKLVG